MTNFKDEFESQLAGMNDRFDTLRLTSASEISHLHLVLKTMEAGFCKNGFNRTKLDADSRLSLTSTDSTLFSEHDGGACGDAFRLAAKALADAVDLTAPGKPIANSYESAANGAIEDQSVATSQEDANTHPENESCDVLHGLVSQTHERLPLIRQDVMTRT